MVITVNTVVIVKEGWLDQKALHNTPSLHSRSRMEASGASHAVVLSIWSLGLKFAFCARCSYSSHAILLFELRGLHSLTASVATYTVCLRMSAHVLLPEELFKSHSDNVQWTVCCA